MSNEWRTDDLHPELLIKQREWTDSELDAPYDCLILTDELILDDDWLTADVALEPIKKSFLAKLRCFFGM